MLAIAQDSQGAETRNRFCMVGAPRYTDHPPRNCHRHIVAIPNLDRPRNYQIWHPPIITECPYCLDHQNSCLRFSLRLPPVGY